MRCRHEAVPPNVAGRVRRQRDRRLRRRGGNADPDLPGLRAAHDAGPEPEDGRGVHGGQHCAVLRPAAAVRGNTGAIAPNIERAGRDDERRVSVHAKRPEHAGLHHRRVDALHRHRRLLIDEQR